MILFQMDYRTKNRVAMHESVVELQEYYTEFEEEFTTFFEELQLHCSEKLNSFN
jgi:acyl carrier protein phosphodiesterase